MNPTAPRNPFRDQLKLTLQVASDRIAELESERSRLVAERDSALRRAKVATSRMWWHGPWVWIVVGVYAAVGTAILLSLW